MTSPARNAVDRSANALGLGFSRWTRNDLSVILNHYGVRIAAEDSKNTLIEKLNQLALERGLTRVDRLAIVRAHTAGLRLPTRKPFVRAPVALSTVPRTAATLPTNVHSEEPSADASDGSDNEISDGDDIEEVPTLSDEERDLREYTSSMNLPQRGGKRRLLRSHLTASKPNNSSLPVNHPTMENRRATMSGTASVHDSTPVPLNRTGTMRHRTSNHRAPPRPTEGAPISQPRSQVSASKTTKAINHECLICYGLIDPVQNLVRQPTLSCEHEVNVCKSCLSTSISSQLENKLWTRISCPALACDKLLEYNDIQEFAEPHVFARYFDFTFQAAQAGSHFQRCRTPGCISGQQCFPEDTIMNCQECHHKTCITCDTEMHPGISCREKIAEREAAQQIHELATTRYLEMEAKACPGCKAPSQKTGGCDHMTCKSCGHEYCWRCLADHGPINEYGNDHHEPTCKYHSDNL